jgi:hypothetical protein
MPSALIIGIAAVVLILGLAVFLRRRHNRARELYQHHLEDALVDGVLTEGEADELAGLRQDHALSEAEVRMVALTIYRRALHNAMADSRITTEEEATLRRLQKLLGLGDADLRDDRRQMQRVHLLAKIERGELPRVDPPVVLDSGEICHWVVQARLAQKLTIPGPARPPFASLQFQVNDGAPFHVDGERSPLRDNEEILPLDMGMLLVTSRRILFRGARRGATLPHVKLEGIELFEDGLRLEAAANEPSLLFLLDDAELSAAILLSAARARRLDLRGAVPGRSA